MFDFVSVYTRAGRDSLWWCTIQISAEDMHSKSGLKQFSINLDLFTRISKFGCCSC